MFHGTWFIDMTLSLNNEQLLTLLEAVHAAAHVCPSPEIIDLENSLLQKAIAEGVPGIVFEEDRLMLGNIFTKPLHDRLNEYEELVFWRSLSEEMADKDLCNELGEEAVAALTDEEYFEKSEPLIAEYDAEFKQHGTDRLILDYRMLLK
jgi:hypothetical protein